MHTFIIPYSNTTVDKPVGRHKFFEVHTLRAVYPLTITFYNDFDRLSEALELRAGLTFSRTYNRFIVQPKRPGSVPADSQAWITWTDSPVRNFETQFVETVHIGSLQAGDVAVNTLTASGWDARMIRHEKGDAFSDEGYPEVFVPWKHKLRTLYESSATWNVANVAFRRVMELSHVQDEVAVQCAPLVKSNVDRNNFLALNGDLNQGSIVIAQMNYIHEVEDDDLTGPEQNIWEVEIQGCIRLNIHKWRTINLAASVEQKYFLTTIWKKVRGLPWA